ncbi:hypothetical protein Nizo2259_2756 [Lactiplantibacillus plantarum]|uniref:Uncharacterized protein n=1 Tax=Lactiplantibacillus plantarum TaxID=1590 RepID=A0A165IC88_LACPN|nr:hypothetical protein JM48_0418 [Lactiplantibacillus plantarum]ETF13328.1 hypothetical protein N654_0163 [Lactiplantibacillus plantarum 4_3]ASL78867.1 hypothetical protein GBLP1_g0383 [Lactiplantibacillus plantarum]KFL91094.1 hypothetical protein LpDm1_0745 [Lactiplantibacillus plantarum]KZD97237.1 hypothetical protein FBR5_1352 [Lactiplantibacillus plantarum]
MTVTQRFLNNPVKQKSDDQSLPDRHFLMLVIRNYQLHYFP